MKKVFLFGFSEIVEIKKIKKRKITDCIICKTYPSEFFKNCILKNCMKKAEKTINNEAKKIKVSILK